MLGVSKSRNRADAEVLLINPNLMKPPVTPVAIDFLSSRLRAAGFPVRFLDLAFEEDIDLALEREVGGHSLFVGISVRNIDDSFFATRDFCLSRIRPIIQKIRKLTDAPIVLGGVGYSVFPIAALEYCGGDYGIQGDGEHAIVHLAESFVGNGSLSSVPGLVSRNNGEYNINKNAPVNLSGLELDDRTTVDNERYLREGGMVGFESKRGCASSCTYCADIPAKGRQSRLRPPEQVAREIASLAAKGIDHFQTCDSEFNIPYRHAANVCREFIKTGLESKIRWYAYLEPRYFDDSLASLMKRAGCAGINFGADHINPQILNTLGRKHTAEMIGEARDLCQKHRMPCMFDLLLGAPGETPETLREIVGFMKRIDPSCVGASQGVRIYPGTPLAQMLALQIRSNGRGIYGAASGKTDLLEPVYFLSPELGENPHELLLDMIGEDERFFTASPLRGGGDFNYNNNSTLSEAIRAGERGTFWDILRRISIKSTLI
jgi:radical SAM superfamily enzyme YgiQ (UPF0313 family)